MSESSEIRAKLKAIVGIDDIPASLLGVVVSVDETEMTCTVTPNIGGANFTDVMLMADNETTSLGIFYKPKVGSQVMISPYSDVDYFVSMVSEVDEVWLRGTANGGIVKVSDLVTKLNNLENKVNTLIATFNAHVHPGVTVGAGSTLVTATLVTGTLTPTIANDIQSTTVKHG
jgi:hypothetical protein